MCRLTQSLVGAASVIAATTGASRTPVVARKLHDNSSIQIYECDKQGEDNMSIENPERKRMLRQLAHQTPLGAVGMKQQDMCIPSVYHPQSQHNHPNAVLCSFVAKKKSMFSLKPIEDSEQRTQGASSNTSW
jgi:hypothetical protein